MSPPTLPFVAGLGIDGASAGWVVAGRGRPLPRLRLVPALEAIADEIAAVGALVDIPIGLPGGAHPSRDCDREARRRLGPRRSSVFPAPARVTLASPDWATANTASRAETGRGLPRQSWGLVPKIRGVDELLRRQVSLRGRLRESHPELAFAWLAGGRPLDRPKSDPAGLEARWTLLEGVWPGVEEATSAWRASRSGVGPHDVADALALLALAAAGVVPLPGEPQEDETGRPMEILVHPSFATPGVGNEP